MNDTATWVGRRIKEAREAAGLTQADLAAVLGITQTAVSYWEAGKRAPGLDDIVKLTRALHRDAGDFFPDAPSRSRVRALLRATAEQLDHTELDVALQQLLDDAEELEPPTRTIRITSSRPQRAAREVLDQLGRTRLPIPVEQVAEACGAHVLREEFEDALSGVLIALDGWAVIGVNETHAMTRQRFTIGHELGHHLLNHHDRFHIDLGPADAYGTPPGYDWQSERAANDFAAELLMPADLVRAEFDPAIQVPALARTFEVSPLAMSYRLVNLGLR
jgi:Zn-dependent peptidase ImmA (M78 family)/DNA-binding XRE family transcriptional regulator